MNVLLIEPDPVLAGRYAELLSREGFDVHCTGDAQGAIVAADKQTPDLIIMEPLLATHSGMEFLYEFRTYPDWQGIPTIILSRIKEFELGLTDKARQELGVKKILYKPETSLAKLARVAHEVTT